VAAVVEAVAVAGSTHLEISILRETSQELLRLIEGSDHLMTSLYPSESNHLEDVHALLSDNTCLCGATIDGALAGIGAVKVLRDNHGQYGEIKRVFVDPEYRGKGVANEIMSYLECHLTSLDIRISRLEVGALQPEALTLYRKLGYVERAPFGNYKKDPHSLFMEKHLTV
jgi:putative acetyltransferase